MISSKGRRARAFTLVELLVVIGIIAILIGILLPVMGRVRAQARTVSCQANIRSILQSLFIYAADNKGSLPYGFIYNQMKLEPGPGRSGAAIGTAYSFNCYSQMTKIMQPKTNSGGLLSAYGFNKVFKCPEGTMSPEFVQPIHYAQHSVAMPDITKEIAGYPPTLGGGQESFTADCIKPARLTDLFPDNALIWDTPLNLSFQNWLPDIAPTQTGPVWSYIDNGQLCYPDFPEYRYRNNEDPTPTDPFYGWGYPVAFSNNNTVAYTSAGYAPNSDNTHSAPAGSITYDNFHTGNLRFRHNGGNVCNVGFADGVVRPLAWFPKRYVKDTTAAEFSADNEMLRKYIMIKWPKNKHPSWANS